MDDITYERPLVKDFGTLSELTASHKMGGPEDALTKGVGAHGTPPGHTSPTGPPPAV